jgi:regulator of sigma E protease|tara:strand:+ start:4336 stop:5892 length:1557 start_codon:yes stop_codon:yes gene_type:complete
MQIFISIFTLSLIITPLVVLHELGHYIFAKFFKVRVLEFGIGFPPRFFSLWSHVSTYKISKNIKIDLNEFKLNEIIYITLNNDGLINEIYKSKNPSNASSIIPVKIKEINEDKIIVKTMLWSLNLIPFGGFVRLFGEEKNHSKDSLSQSSYFGRFVIISSGAFINFILPFIMIFFVNIFITETKISDLFVQNVMDDSPAFKAGIKPGDKIVTINNQKINSISDLQSILTQNLGNDTEWTVVSGVPKIFVEPGQKTKYEYPPYNNKTFNLKPRWNPPVHHIGKDISVEKARIYDPYSGSITSFKVSKSSDIGNISYEFSNKFVNSKIGDIVPIVFDKNFEGIPLEEARKLEPNSGINDTITEGSVGILISSDNKRNYKQSFSENLKDSIHKSFGIYTLSYYSIKGIFIRSSNPIFQGPKAIGPIGLGQISGNVVSSSNPISEKIIVLFTLASSISLSLAIINLIPFPALDGGRLAFLFIEIFRKGKKVPESIESYIHGMGFIILILLIIYISFKDISRL